MAFAFNSAGGPSVKVGAELDEITTEGLGFSALGGEKKLKLLPSPWPSDNLPPSSSSLLSVASKRGLLAAAGPEGLIITSTEGVHKAFGREASDQNVITNFSPDITIQVPQLRHVAFSSNEDFLVITAENGGGLAVYATQDLLQQKSQPAVQISTNQVSVRALVPNPNPEFESYFAVVLETGQLLVSDIANQQVKKMPVEGITCASWSVKGKQVVAGLSDGTAIQFWPDAMPAGNIPRPPAVEPDFAVSGISWLANEEFFIIHSPKGAASGDDDAMQEDQQESIYHVVKTDKGRTTFSFSKLPTEPLWPGFGPKRNPPPRYSISRLRKWAPSLEDILILAASHSTDISVITNSSAPLAPEQTSINEYTRTDTLDNRRAQLPQTVVGDDEETTDSLLIGEALDLSSKEKLRRPIPVDEEIEESPTPLPAFLVLNQQGLLCAWWIVYDASIRAGEQGGYSGLTALSRAQSATPSTEPQPSTQTSSMFAKPTATFGVPSTPTLGSSGFSTGNASFGKPSFGLGGSTPSFGKPSQPAFGSTSSIGASGGSGFGSTGTIGNRQYPWSASTQAPIAQSQSNPFSSAAGGPSGFAKFGANAGTNTSTTASPFSSFGTTNGGQSSFATLGQKPSQSAFAGSTNASSAFKGTSTEPSFGSTVTVGSSLGGGSTLPSWANTPAQQGGSIFGGGTSSFGSTKESDMSDADDAQNRERDEATPTPQAPPQQPKGLFGLPANGFKLSSSFKGDGSAKDDLPKPPISSGGSLFGSDFSSALGGSSSNPPATPIKKEEQEPKLQDISTTPASPPKAGPTKLFPNATPITTSQTPAKEPPKEPESAPPSEEESPVGEDAPLPPDPMTWKPPKRTDDDLPPLAGSPAIKVEAPESSVPSSPLDDEGGDISVEEQEEEEEEEPSPSDAARRPRPQKTGWTLTDSVSQSPRILPQAPTPPVVKSGASSRSRNPSRSPSRSPVRPSVFQQTSKSAGPSIFQQSSTPAGFPKPNTIFPAPSMNRVQNNLRSPSPIRSASTPAISTRRQPIIPAQATPLAASIPQPPMPPTPQPEVYDLSDDEDERIRQELASEVLPSRSPDPFLAHQDYTGSVTKPGIPGQIELMYRDINSMIDTLGLNARSLAAFIKYHQERTRQTKLTRNDLDEVIDQGEGGDWYEKWCLAEIDDLKALEMELEQSLDSGRIQNVLDKLAQLARLQREKAKLMTKINEIRRQILNRKNTEKAEVLRHAQLPKEQADQQKALRNEYARLLGLLGDAEQAIVLLRSKLASHNAENGQTKAVPTVDAVKKTINKMIAMTEKKNNDILLLESQMRKIGPAGSRPGSSGSRGFGTPTRARSAKGMSSPFATPPASKGKMSLSELNKTVQTPEQEDDTPSRGFGLFYTPEGSPTRAGFNLRLADDMGDEDMAFLKDCKTRRKKTASSLTEAILKRGVKVTRVN
ncbi:hypothetical protein K469DRAFT_645790 [Zopfia rhizophila CBS 207.26]|uniref:Nucleoporin Nup159/Nup146 N-terminal domain-containing protein n=1 Tax=Zopfia rhizophila CBS 207.26 TaxID=1314779 RepID=A0A6A6DA64_9PEZI|nr:hypothetical protein K469DRAFT_645790 [Zopfia rhizophila CBS 207.26]